MLLSLIIYILALPFLFLKSRQTKYQEAIPARFFLKNNKFFSQEKLWFHACSMGEVQALKSIIDELEDEVNISVITNTGKQKALSMTNNVRYLPYELFLPFWIKKQKALVVMEAELWYFMFLFARINKIPTYLINARISDKSYASYKKYTWFYKYIFSNIDKIFAQSIEDKKRLEELGASNIEVIGNIKLTNLPKVNKNIKKLDEVVITAGSTHESEEKLVLESWNKDLGKLIIVPRHPERFDEVYLLIENMFKNTNTSYHRYTNDDSLNSDIVLIDVMGELNNIYAISDVVILGGGFIKSAGGHNPIEPAFFNTKLISGKTIFNQKSLFECVNNYYLIEENELKSYLVKIDELKQTSLGQKGDISPILKELEQYK